MATDRTGVFIIRAWVEEGSAEPLRAHILMTNDVSGGYEREVTLYRPEAVSVQVEEWLSQFFSDVERPGSAQAGPTASGGDLRFTVVAETTGEESLSGPQAAELLGLQLNTLQALIDRGELAADILPPGKRSRRGRRAIRISREAIGDYLQRGRDQPGEVGRRED